MSNRATNCGIFPKLEVLVRFSFYHFQARKKPVLHKGKGILRGDILSAFYYSSQEGSRDSGVVTLMLKGDLLLGSFMQYDSHEIEEPFIPSQRFCLIKIQLSKAEGKMVKSGEIGFCNYSSIKTMHGKALESAPLSKIKLIQ